MFEHLQHTEAKYNELTQALASPEIVSDSARYQKTAKAHAELSAVVEKPSQLLPISIHNDLTRLGSDIEAGLVGVRHAISTPNPN